MLDGDRDLMPGLRALRRDGRCHTVAVRHAGGRNEARSDDRRDDQLEGAIAIGEGLDVLALVELDRRPGHQVRQRLGEDVGPLLVEQARQLAGVARRLVAPTRVLAALDVGLDDPIAGLHGHRIHAAPRSESGKV